MTMQLRRFIVRETVPTTDVRRMRMLIPMDSSPHAANTLQFALQLALGARAEIHLVHIPSYSTRHEETRGGNKMRAFKEFIEESGITVCSLESLAGNADRWEKLESLVHGILPDMIVLARDCFETENLHRIVRKAPCPVVVVPHTAVPRVPASVVLCSNRRRLDEFVLYPLLHFVTLHSSRLSILNVVRRRGLGTRKFDSHLPPMSGKVPVTFYQKEGWDQVSVIDQHIRSQGLDMVCTSVNDRSILGWLTSKWSYLKLIQRVNVPVMVLQTSWRQRS